MQGDGRPALAECRLTGLEVEMLDRANSGPEPCAEILRAIRHGVAAGACSVAARETRDPKWWRLAQEPREKARAILDRRLVRNV